MKKYFVMFVMDVIMMVMSVLFSLLSFALIEYTCLAFGALCTAAFACGAAEAYYEYIKTRE